MLAMMLAMMMMMMMMMPLDDLVNALRT